MEAKDLVLLALIPLMLIGLIVYTDKAPAITGFVAAKQEKSSIFGTYSIAPSFKVNVDYSLEEYENLKKHLKQIAEDCKNKEEIDKCLKGYSNQLGWNCEEDEASAILQDFIDKFNECLNLKENGVVCMFSLEERESSAKSLEIVFEYEDDKTKVSLKQGDKVLATDYINLNDLVYTDNYETKESKNVDLVKFSIYFSDKKPVIREAIAISENELVKLSNMLLFYKVNDEIKFIEANQEGNFRADVPANKIIDLPLSKGVKFCAKSNKYIDDYSSKPIVYKFSFVYPDLPPPPIKGIIAFDKPKSEKAVLLKWQKSPAKNVAKYRIYYAESSLNVFEKTPTQDLRKNQNVLLKEINTNQGTIDLDNEINAKECEFNYENKKCSFAIDGKSTSIEANKLYYFKSTDSYLYSLVLPKDANYDITVTAIGKNSKEINNIAFNQKLPVIKPVKAIDDLPPDSSKLVVVKLQQIYDSASKKVSFIFGDKPTTNIDQTQLNDFKNYKIYYAKYKSLSQQDKSKTFNLLLDKKLNELQFIGNVNYEQSGALFSIDLTQTNPQKDDIYFFVIISSDTLGNPKEEQFKVKELGAVPLQLTIQ